MRWSIQLENVMECEGEFWLRTNFTWAKEQLQALETVATDSWPGVQPSKGLAERVRGWGACGINVGLRQTAESGPPSSPRETQGRLLRKALLFLLFLLFPLLLSFILCISCVPSHQCQGTLFTHRGFGIPVLKQNKYLGKCQKWHEFTGILLKIEKILLRWKGQAAIKLWAFHAYLIQILCHWYFYTIWDFYSRS